MESNLFIAVSEKQQEVVAGGASNTNSTFYNTVKNLLKTILLSEAELHQLKTVRLQVHLPPLVSLLRMLPRILVVQAQVSRLIPFFCRLSH